MKRWPSLVAAGAAGASLAGLLVACLTLRLNPQVHENRADVLVLVGLFLAGYGVAGGIVGGAVSLLLAGLRRLRRERRLPEAVPRLLAGGLAVGPPLIGLLLPDVGLSRTLLTWWLFGASVATRLLALAVVATLVLVLGWLVGLAVRRLAKALGSSPAKLSAALWLLAVVVVSGALLVRIPDPPRSVAAGEDWQELMADRPRPRPVVLLCIDGADPDDVLLPLVREGQLPNFERLMREGVWGELSTLVPALSPAIWTTLVTGKLPQEHGIHQFVVFRLPGVKRPLLRFPLHAGLNFELFPRLERLPGMPVFQVPYTSNMRRTKALWNIVQERYRVGVYRWRVSWPAERVKGFNVASGVALLDNLTTLLEGQQPLGGQRRMWPPRVLEGAPGIDGTPPSDQTLRRYVGPQATLDRRDPRIVEIVKTLEDPTVEHLLYLQGKYRPRLVVAAFFSVDGFQHLFGRHRGEGGPFSEAIDERYRRVDERLGELLAGLGKRVNLILVSDHGFDFRGLQHTHGPPGLFLARGPAFRRGAEVEGLSVLDIAPMILHLLGFPLPEDMPGAVSGTYRRALRPRFLENHGVPTIRTYETGERASYAPAGDPDLEETKRRLRALGYID